MTLRQRDIRLFVPVYVILLIIYLIACFIEPAFFTWNNNVNLWTRITPLVFLGVAQTLVILTGGIDLSIGAIVALTNVIAASLPFVDAPANIVLWFIVPLAVGTAAGLLNGLLITRGGFTPLIVTLAMGVIWDGVSLFILSEPGGNISSGLTQAVTGTIFGVVPIPLILLLVILAAAQFILMKTTFGRSIYAVGGSEKNSIESGIDCRKTKVAVYCLSGLLAGLAGLYLSGLMNSGDPLVGDPYVLNSVAVAVIGGTSLSGGIGGVIGVLGGAYILDILSNILNLLAISTFYQYVAKGLVLIIALTITSSGSIGGIRIFKPSRTRAGGLRG